MLLDIVLLIVGLVLISKGGDLFVDSSIDIARALNVPRIVIGATIVSLGTTMPELMVSSYASMIGDSGIAIGNAVGSAIANIALVIGVISCIVVIRVDLDDFKRRSLWMIVAAILVILFSWNLYIPRYLGLILFVLALLYLFADYRNIKAHKARARQEASEVEKVEEPQKTMNAILFFVVGLVMVIVGSRLLVSSGISIAEALKVPSVVIGLSVIAVGTSLPELITGIASARKKVPDLAIGNIVGANVLNLALITGFAALIKPLTLTRFTQVYSFTWLIIFIAYMMVVLLRSGRVGRSGGLVGLALYAVYIGGLVYQAL